MQMDPYTAVDALLRPATGKPRCRLWDSFTAMTDLVLTEHHDGGVALLRLNRPPMNPLSMRTARRDLRDAARVLGGRRRR